MGATDGYECTGALFTGVDINKLNTLNNENGCMGGMLGLSTQLKGYHCLSFKNCPGAGCTCEVREGCSSSTAAADTTAACLYGVEEASECPADAQVASPSTEASSASPRSRGAVVVMALAASLFNKHTASS